MNPEVIKCNNAKNILTSNRCGGLFHEFSIKKEDLCPCSIFSGANLKIQQSTEDIIGSLSQDVHGNSPLRTSLRDRNTYRQ
ncbi:MAG: hypothetical protein ACLRZG_04725 [Streptococcus sp.]